MMSSGFSTGHCLDDKAMLTQHVCTCVCMQSLGYTEALF